METLSLLKSATFISKIIINLIANKVANKFNRMAAENAAQTALDGVERNDYRRVKQIAEKLGSDGEKIARKIAKQTEAEILASLHHVRCGLMFISKAIDPQRERTGGGEVLSHYSNRHSVEAAKFDFQEGYSKARSAYPNENLEFGHRVRAFEIILFCQMMLHECSWDTLWEQEVEYFMKLPLVRHSTKKGKGIKHDAVVVFLRALLRILREANPELASRICQKCPSIEQIYLVTEGQALPINLGLSFNRMQISFKQMTLHRAAMEGNNDALTQVSESELNVLDECGFSPLHYAVAFNHVKCVQTLLRAHADIEYPTGNRETALHLAACEDNRLDILELLIFRSANIHAMTDVGHTPLHTAAAAGAQKCMRALIKAGANVNSTQHSDFVAPLHIAASHNHVNCLEDLISYGADIEMKTINLNTSIFSATISGSLACLNLLISKGANVNARNDEGHTALHCAARFGKLDCLIALLDAKVPVDCPASICLRTPLDFAVHYNQLDCLKMLILKGANVNAKTKRSNSPLQIAAAGGNLDCLLELIKNKADLNPQDDDGDTALHDAACYNRLDCAKALIEARADPTIRNNNRQFAHDTARVFNGPDSDCYYYLARVFNEQGKSFQRT